MDVTGFLGGSDSSWARVDGLAILATHSCQAGRAVALSRVPPLQITQFDARDGR